MQQNTSNSCIKVLRDSSKGPNQQQSVEQINWLKKSKAVFTVREIFFPRLISKGTPFSP